MSSEDPVDFVDEGDMTLELGPSITGGHPNACGGGHYMSVSHAHSSPTGDGLALAFPFHASSGRPKQSGTEL